MSPLPLGISNRWVTSSPGLPRSQSPPRVERSAGERNPRGLLIFAVEALAFVGLIVVLAISYRRLQVLNEQVREAQEHATMQGSISEPVLIILTPTPLRVLPGGRQARTQGASLGEGELDLLALPVSHLPTPGPQSPRRIVIPRIDVDAPVVDGDGWEDLKKGVGHHPGSAVAGEPDNMILSAHNDIYGEIFRDLSKLEPGDEVLIYTDSGAYRYIANRVEIVEPTRIEFIEPTDYPVLTLVTCHPYLLDTHRVIVVADLAQ